MFLVRYLGPFLKWTRDEHKQVDQRTRKLMTMHKALHPSNDVDRLYVSRKERGRGLAIIEDSVDTSIQRLEDYIGKHERGLITTIRNNTDNTIDNRKTITRKQRWEEKQLYGRSKRLINISHDKTWTWLRKGNFKRETESLLIAVQNNTLRTNHIKARRDKIQQNSKCRLCVLYRHNHNIDLRASMNERTHLFIKIYISHTLFSKGLTFLWRVRDGLKQGQTAILTQLLLLTIAHCYLQEPT